MIMLSVIFLDSKNFENKLDLKDLRVNDQKIVKK